jgi:hypothetical protein
MNILKPLINYIKLVLGISLKRKMDRNAIKPYRLTDEEEVILWKDAIIVFDSSALLDLYFSPKSERVKINNEIFKELKDRLWIPNHVQYEYLKNREKIIKKPITEKYDPLKKKIEKFLINGKSDITKRIDEIIRETINSDNHPHLPQKHFDDYKKIVDEFLKQKESFQKQTEVFQKNILDEIKSVEKEITDVEGDDDVLDSLETHFKVGREFSFEEIIEITKEGKHRFEFKIPPGYGDLYKGEKKGTQIFADLIIWKQILEFSKEAKKPIIFITNDISKDEDWCYLDKKATEQRIYSPREELIKEIKDNSSVDFWMYNLPQFLYQANEHLKSTIKEETIKNFFQFINTKKTKSNYLKFKCDSCGRIHKHSETEFDLDFDCIGGSERNMGTENQYEAQEHFKCNCGNDIEVRFELWEYPIGVHNYDNIEIDNAELLDSFHFTIDFFEDEHEPDFCTCHQCTGNKDEMGNGVVFDYNQDIINEYDSTHPNHKFSSVKYGNCDWCNELHIRCTNCGSVTLLSQHHENEEIECEGGCGLKYTLDTSDDFEQIGDYNIKLIDHRIEKCSGCGKDFIDKNSTELCDECEKEYNEK